MTRNVLFVSHANPEDNEFALWLSLRLAREGYAVWCELTKLLGGEDFWKNAEKAIREGTAKFLYVLSRTSNSKDGPLAELSVAKKVARANSFRDFIIPLRIDDLPHSEIEIELSRLNAITFSTGWAAGLQSLLKKLREDAVPMDSRFNPAVVASWWNTKFGQEQFVRKTPETCLSNWFAVLQPPRYIHLYEVLGQESGSKREAVDRFAYPTHRLQRYLVSFAGPRDLTGRERKLPNTGKHFRLPTMAFLDGKAKGVMVDRREAKDAVVRLLRLAWDRMLDNRTLPTYQLSGNIRCVYPPTGFAKNDEVIFAGPAGKRQRRALIGYKTVTNAATGSKHKRYWHFAVHAEPILWPRMLLAIKAHVVFSRDGKSITGSPDEQHRARRSQCKQWWNDDWRDRILAMMAWLAQGNEGIWLCLGSRVGVSVPIQPILFLSPVSYLDKDIEAFPDDEEEALADDDVTAEEDLEGELPEDVTDGT
jgi:hypothetical protein